MLWKPSSDFIEQSQLKSFEYWINQNKQIEFKDYQDIWEWSVNNIDEFWECIWEYFDINYSGAYDQVLSKESMPGADWFPGTKLNYAEHIFRNATDEFPAIIFKRENHETIEISWKQMLNQVGKLQRCFRENGVTKGDRVVAFLPNIPEATIAWLATVSLGAIWSSCSPDFGAPSVIDRFSQIEPKILVTVDGYSYGGRPFNKMDSVLTICNSLSSLSKVICIPYLNQEESFSSIDASISWSSVMQLFPNDLQSVKVEFSHPIWVLYSSGTTGKPKAITHSHGGVLLEHYKYLAFHNDVHKGERFFWYSTTGWMMWNFVQASMLMGTTIVLYDGSPAFPDLNVLWEFAAEVSITHFGTSAPYLIACMKNGIRPNTFNLKSLRSIGSTGSSLPDDAFNYVYDKVKEDVWLCSMSGGTDICTAFVGGVPFYPVNKGEIQGRALGCALYAYNDKAERIYEELGEMVVEKPMPSMPVYFWNDKGNTRYFSSYFTTYPGVWRHGDWVKIRNNGSLIIYGRSDATLNRQGIRIGTSEIYSVLDQINEIKDSLIINLELDGGMHFMPLFVIMKKGFSLNDSVKHKIRSKLRASYSPRHVPDEIIPIHDIPYTISGKKMEAPVKKILMGIEPSKSINIDAMRNPESIDFFVDYRKVIEFKSKKPD